MNIGIDISQIVYKGTGVARFTQGLVDAILEYDTQNHWSFFCSSLRNHLDAKIKSNIQQRKHSVTEFFIPPSLNSFYFNDCHALSKSLHLHYPFFKKLDWFITSDWIEPPLPIPKATIVHDLVFKRYPETVHPNILKTQITRLKNIAEESSLVFADSNSTSHDLVKEYPALSDKTVVNYPGVHIVEPPEENFQSVFLKSRAIEQPYLLSVGKREPRKNLNALMTAFQSGHEKYKDSLLVIAGSPGWGQEEVKDMPNIRILGYVSDIELATLYKNATGFIYPSLYEGFGYPVIEAMQYGCPVATSNTSSLAEISGDAALLFDPENQSSITDAVGTLLNDSKLRDTLIQKGYEKSAEFSWKRYLKIFLTELEHRKKR